MRYLRNMTIFHNKQVQKTVTKTEQDGATERKKSQKKKIY